MAQLTIATPPVFDDMPEDVLVCAQPLRESVIQQLSENAKFGTVRIESIYEGFFIHGDTIPVSTSPVDGYVYSREEITYRAMLFSTREPDGGFSSGQKARPTLVSTEPANSMLLYQNVVIDDTTGLVTIVNVYYNNGRLILGLHVGAGEHDTNHGIVKVYAICQRNSNSASPEGSAAASGNSSSSGGGGVSTVGPMSTVDEPTDSGLVGGVNIQTGATYTVLVDDTGKLIVLNRATAIAVMLPAASTFPEGFRFSVESIGVGLVTITPTTSTIDGAASITVPKNTGLDIFSDGTNYFMQRGAGINQATGDVTAGPGSGSVAFTIPANTVTYAKMQDVSATDKIIGRKTAGSGDPEEIDCTAAGRALIDDADASAQRTTLGLGTVATLASDTDGTLAANSDSSVATQRAVKSYVDASLAGLSWKQAVRAATTANGTLATAFANGQTIDGVTIATGNRILIKNQSTAADNGIYVVAASGAPTRATDADSGAELVNATMYVSEGTTLADTQWTCSTNAPIIPGSTSLAFAQMSSGGITTSGSPASGNLTKFSGSSAITNGDLSGVVTTSGSLVTSMQNDVALPGSPTTTTQSPGDNSTKIATTAFVTAAVAGGGGGAVAQLARQVLGADAATVTFNSISGSYNHLRLIVTGRDIQSALVANTLMRFNNDSGANYDYQYMLGVSTSAAAAQALAQTSALIGNLPGATSARAASRGQFEIFIPDYIDTTLEKTAVITSGTSAGSTGMYAGVVTANWRNAAAITRIDLLATNKFKAGSIFTLYGMS